MKILVFLLLFTIASFHLKAQEPGCILRNPVITIHFGTGSVRDLNTETLYNYDRVSGYCPTDGHYNYTSYTSDCFSNDWLTLSEDHTPGDVDGNMMIVNASPESGSFLTTTINNLKENTTYEFGVWMMNVCRISDKCPFPLLPNITIRLQTPAGKIVAQIGLGYLPRREAPHWTQYKAKFVTPPSSIPLTLFMIDNAPGGCGNDFALDDITFRECIKPVAPPPKPPVIVKKQPASTLISKKQVITQEQVRKEKKPIKPLVKEGPAVKRPLQGSQVGKLQTHTSRPLPGFKPGLMALPPPPAILISRSNPVIKRIETEANEIRLDLYDNGQIDGDTVSIYHNNKLLVSKARLTQKAISFSIAVDEHHPHHELIMVAENLGSIPPNTSLMIVTAGTKRYEIFISSSEQKNAKIVIDWK